MESNDVEISLEPIMSMVSYKSNKRKSGRIRMIEWDVDEANNVWYAKKGKSIGTLRWILNEGTLTIKGKGEMPDYFSADSPWHQHKESIHTIIMENGITNIGEDA